MSDMIIADAIDRNTQAIKNLDLSMGDAETLEGANLLHARDLPYCIFSLSSQAFTGADVVKFNSFYTPFPSFFEQSNPATSLSGDAWRTVIKRSGLYMIHYALWGDGDNQEFITQIVWEQWSIGYAGEQKNNQGHFPNMVYPLGRICLSGFSIIGAGFPGHTEIGMRLFPAGALPFTLNSFPASLDPTAPEIFPYMMIHRLSDFSGIVEG